MHEVQVNRLGGLSLPRKSVVRLTDRPDMTLDVYCGRKTTTRQFCFSHNTLKAPRTNIAEFAHSIDPDEAAHRELHHRGLHCLPSSI